MTDERLYLTHILESIVRVEEYTRAGRGDFFASTFTQDATLRNLQIMAESTQRLSTATKIRHPEIPWREIAGFRNKITHGYFDINLEIVWDVVERFLPPLKHCVTTIIAERYGADFDAHM
ncbi:MAG: HepT-like ribonuclease domain-containing protein [Thermomicrobiales bacterium]